MVFVVMNLTLALVPASWSVIADILFAPFLIYLLFKFPRYLFAKNYNVFFAFCVGLMVLWSMKAGIRAGMEYHFLGATLLTLMFGWQLAILGLMMESIVQVLMDEAEWQMFCMNVWLSGVLPVAISSLILYIVENKLYPHFITYFFVGAFVNAAITIALTVYIAALVMVAGGGYSYNYISYEYLPYILLMFYPEAFLTGFIIVIMVVNYPQWVFSFDDKKYPLNFGGKSK
jgi:uncharacterized membrane protein